MKKFFSVLGNIFVVLFLLVALAVMASVLTSQKGNGLPDLYGYSPLAVQSDSMEPTFKKGDLVIIQKRNDYNALNEGDIVTFFAFKDGQKYYDTHRIVKVKPHNQTNYYVTRGDNSIFDDLNLASYSNIVGVYTGYKVPYLGGIMDFLKTQTGIFICIVLPLALLFIWQLFKFISVFTESKKQKAVEEMAVDIEAEKQKAIEEYIAQQKAQEQAAASAAPPVQPEEKAADTAEEPAKPVEEETPVPATEEPAGETADVDESGTPADNNVPEEKAEEATETTEEPEKTEQSEAAEQPEEKPAD